MIALTPISLADAKAYFEKHSEYRGDFNLAISAADEGGVHGVISMRADGSEFSLGHISTDGNAQIGSLLYGGMVRVAKALGYRAVTI